MRATTSTNKIAIFPPPPPPSLEGVGDESPAGESPRMENTGLSLPYLIFYHRMSFEIPAMTLTGSAFPRDRRRKIKHFLLGDARFEASPAARLIHTRGSYHDKVARFDQPLRVFGGVPAAHADGQGLGNGF